MIPLIVSGVSDVFFFISFSNSVEPDQMLHSVASDLGLHCLPMLILWGN